MANILNGSENGQKIEAIQAFLLEDKDFLRQVLQGALQLLVDAEFEEFIGAAPYERKATRCGYRNGSRPRALLTRVGRIDLRLPRDREGRFSTELFARFQRSERALLVVLGESYFKGVSTRKVREIMEQLCGRGFSRSSVSNYAKQLDELLEAWRHRRLEKSYPYLVADARFEDIREGGVVKSKAVMVVVGVDEKGYREILSVDIGYSESEANWEQVFRDLKARGLRGVRYVVSDDHPGLSSAIVRNFPGAIWQRCQVHFIRNFKGKFSRKEVGRYVHWLKEVFSAPDMEEAQRRCQVLIDKLIEAGKAKIAQWLEEEIPHCFGVYALPTEHRRRMRSTNMLERFNQELKRRTRVVRIFPNDESCLRLVGMLCMEQSEQWQTGYRYLTMEPSTMTVDEPEKELSVTYVV
jgi:transposase-like protein